jgi:hypothetical protein
VNSGYVIVPQAGRNTFVIRFFVDGFISEATGELTEKGVLADLRQRGISEEQSDRSLAETIAAGPLV